MNFDIYIKGYVSPYYETYEVPVFMQKFLIAINN